MLMLLQSAVALLTIAFVVAGGSTSSSISGSRRVQIFRPSDAIPRLSGADEPTFTFSVPSLSGGLPIDPSHGRN